MYATVFAVCHCVFRCIRLRCAAFRSVVVVLSALRRCVFRCIPLCAPLHCIACIICCMPLRVPLYSAVLSAAFRSAARRYVICIYLLYSSIVFFFTPLHCIALYYICCMRCLFRCIPLCSAVFRSAVLSCILCFMPLYSMLLRCVPLSAPLYAICSAAFHSAVLRWIQYLWWLPEKSCGLREASVASVCFRVVAAASGNCGGRAAQCSPGLNLSLSSYHHSRI